MPERSTTFSQKSILLLEFTERTHSPRIRVKKPASVLCFQSLGCSHATRRMHSGESCDTSRTSQPSPCHADARPCRRDAGDRHTGHAPRTATRHTTRTHRRRPHDAQPPRRTPRPAARHATSPYATHGHDTVRTPHRTHADAPHGTPRTAAPRRHMARTPCATYP